MRYAMKKRREELGFTQAEIADLIGIARSTYTNIELGEKNPSFDIMFKVKEALQVEEDGFFLNTDVPFGNMRTNENIQNNAG